MKVFGYHDTMLELQQDLEGIVASDIQIVGMGGNAVEPIPNTKLYRYIFHLSARPEYDWKVLYEQIARERHEASVRRRSTIVDDTIVVEMGAEDDKQEQLDLQKQLVAEVNTKYDAAQEVVARELATRARIQHEAEEELARLREEVKGLKFE